MKLRTDAAQKVSAGRFRIIHELALYVGDSASSLETAVKNAAVNGECYMEHAPKNPKILPTKYDGYKAGSLMVPAYMVQAALDSILREGFQPESEPMKFLTVGLLLTRRSMESICDIKERFPAHWSEQYVDEMLSIAQGLL
ncbi:hypothetical protein [Vibrio sp. B181a]|uniref:hypothetical protein n=1 Tax=Vibrio sp. B181a TaxID=2835906 RepID=UPI0025569B8B|nr:hypothetical protein [Vibrio sp. B181a]MDK9773878.1 hypothetical protein [Vibrio sp. B181a]